MSALQDQDRVLEAMASFSRYQKPELEKFLGRCNLKKGGLKENLVERIKIHLDDGSIPLERAFDYIDELKETGEQHLFLFRLQKSRRNYLQKLRNWDFIRECVATPNDQLPPDQDRMEVQNDIYKSKPRKSMFFNTIMESESPALAAVYQRERPRQALFFKWVETRHWSREERKDDMTISVKTFDERSVNFLHIDLVSGNTEIRIQKLHSNPQQPLRKELELYRELVSQLLDFDAFVPVLIEPVIRRFLSAKIARVVRWQVRWIDVGNLSGGIDPGFVRGVLKKLGNYSAISLAADWLFAQEPYDLKKVRTNLDGRTNQIDLPNRCLPEEAYKILPEIYKVPTAKLHNSELDAIARKNEFWRPMIQQIDSEMSVGGKKEIELSKIAEEVWSTEEETIKTGEEIARKHPKIYRVRYFVSCPETDNPVSNEKGPMHFENKDEIPAEIRCIHAKGKGIATHQTEGRIKAVLLAQPMRKKSQVVPWIGQMLEKKVGKSHIGNFIKAFSFLLFLALYVPLVWVTAWLFLRLTDVFPGGTIIVHLTFFLVLVLEAGIVVALLGKPLTDKARDLIMSLASIFDRRREVGDEFLETKVFPIGKSSSNHRIGPR